MWVKTENIVSNFYVFSVVICIMHEWKTDFKLIFSLFTNLFLFVRVIFAWSIFLIQSVAGCCYCCCILTEKIREFNKFAVKRGGQEFSDKNISLVERLVGDNKFCSAGVDVLWQMLQWPTGRSTALLVVLSVCWLGLVVTRYLGQLSLLSQRGSAVQPGR